MTKAVVQAQINHGNALIAAGDLDDAANVLSQAQVSLSQFARQYPYTAKSLARTLNKTVAKLRAAFVRRDADALQTPSYSSGRAAYGQEGLVQPTYRAAVSTQGNDALIQPSFHGAGMGFSVVPEGGIMPALGFALATLGLVIGIGTLYKSW